MYPVLIDWGMIYISSWHLFYVIGALASYQLLITLVKKYEPSIALEFISKLFVICYISGYFGSRLLSILIEEVSLLQTAPSIERSATILIERLFSFGPMTFYGGALLSGLAGLIYILAKKQPLLQTLDLAIPSGFLALFFGRIGCFLNGDDYGKEIEPFRDGSIPFWAVNLPALGEDIYRWPVQLIEAFLVLLLVLAVLNFFKKLQQGWGYGAVGFLTVMGYANIRLFTEFLRDDFRGYVYFSWLSTSQFISIVILILGSFFGLLSAFKRL